MSRLPGRAYLNTSLTSSTEKEEITQVTSVCVYGGGGGVGGLYMYMYTCGLVHIHVHSINILMH